MHSPKKEPPHDESEMMTRVERRRAARKARAVKAWKKAAAGAVAVATLFGGMGVASTALAADRDSYQDTVGNSSFEAARNQYGLTKHMKNGAILHAWMWSFKTITQHMPEIAAAVAVSGTGNVYAVQAGTAKVSAKVDGKTVSVTVTVK